MTTKQPEQLCVFCAHWRFDGGSPHYSTLTPGDCATMSCAAAHYKELDLDYSEKGFRGLILRAQICPDYECVGEDA